MSPNAPNAEERPDGFDAAYRILHKIASRQMSGQARQITLQTTALVHEAWLKLRGLDADRWADEGRFRALAAQTVRSILVDYARARHAEKRGQAAHLGFEVEALQGGPCDAAFVLDLDETLQRLHVLDEQVARVAELRIFGGLTNPEISRTDAVPLRTVERSWATARAWLRKEISRAG